MSDTKLIKDVSINGNDELTDAYDLSETLQENTVNAIGVDASSRTIWINGQPYGNAYVNITDDDNIEAPIGAEVFNDFVHNAATGKYSHAEGSNTTANGASSHSEGNSTTAKGSNSHAEGGGTTAGGVNSHAEGTFTSANGFSSHAEGGSTTAEGDYSHSEGKSTSKADIGENDTITSITARWKSNKFSLAYGSASHVEGNNNLALGDNSHAEGKETTAAGEYSHTEGEGTITTIGNYAEHAQGKYNVSNTDTIHSIGIGSSTNDRKNAYEILNTGEHYIYNLGGYDGTNPTNSKDLATILSTVDTSNNNGFNVEKTLTVDGDTTLKGTVTLGDAPSDVININGTVAGNIKSNVNDGGLIFNEQTNDDYKVYIQMGGSSIVKYTKNPTDTTEKVSLGTSSYNTAIKGNVITLKGPTTINENLTVAEGKSTTLGGDLDVYGTSFLSGAVTCDDDLTVHGTTILSTATVTGDLDVTNNTTVGGTLGVTGATILNSTLGVVGTTSLGDKLSISKNGLAVVGDSQFSGNVGIGSTQTNKNLTVYGNIKGETNSYIGGCLNIGLGALDTTYTCKVNGTLNVTGNSTLNTLTSSTIKSTSNIFTYINGDSNAVDGDTTSGLYMSNRSINSHVGGSYKRSLISFSGNLNTNETQVNYLTEVKLGSYCRLTIGSKKYPSLVKGDKGTDNWGLDCNNSDIVGVNSIAFNDTAENATKGILFKHRNAGTDVYSSIWVSGAYSSSVPKFSRNVRRLVHQDDRNITDYDIYYSGASLTPYTGSSYDIGSTSKKFKNLYLSGASTIDGNSTVGGNLIVSGVGNSTFGGSVSITSNLSVTNGYGAFGSYISAFNYFVLNKDYNNKFIDASATNETFKVGLGTSSTLTFKGITTFDAGSVTINDNAYADGFYENSDATKKDIVSNLDIDFDKLKQIPKVNFTWKNDPEKKNNIGTIAQELNKVYPEVVDGEEGNMTVDYAKLSIIALAAIDKLEDRIKQLEDKLYQYEKIN